MAFALRFALGPCQIANVKHAPGRPREGGGNYPDRYYVDAVYMGGKAQCQAASPAVFEALKEGEVYHLAGELRLGGKFGPDLIIHEVKDKDGKGVPGGTPMVAAAGR